MPSSHLVSLRVHTHALVPLCRYYLSDLKVLQQEGLLRTGSMVVADNLTYPGGLVRGWHTCMFLMFLIKKTVCLHDGVLKSVDGLEAEAASVQVMNRVFTVAAWQVGEGLPPCCV